MQGLKEGSVPVVFHLIMECYNGWCKMNLHDDSLSAYPNEKEVLTDSW